ncbi:MAG: ABC transporter ATP-binding protein [Chloroflexi bacterium]|nr:ABC transporter ATP-binding protein [Chloroflexota bacterium]
MHGWAGSHRIGPPPSGGRMGGGRLSSSLDAEYDDDVLGSPYDSRVIKRLPKYFAPVKKWLVLGALGVLVRSLAGLAIPYLVIIAIDDFILTKDMAGLIPVVIAFIAANLLIWGGQYAETLFLTYAGESILFRLRREMFDHLHRLSMSFFDHNKVGKLMSRVQNDVTQVQELITNDIINIVASALTLLAIAIAMITINAKLALITLTTVPTLGIIMFVWQRYARRAFIRVRQAIAVVNDQLQEGISGVRVTQSMSREKVNIQQFDAANRAHLNANVSAARLQAMMLPTVEILTSIAFGIVIVVGGSQVIGGIVGIGVLTGFLLYIQRFFAPVQEMAMLYTELQRGMASGARIFELLDVRPEIVDRPGAIELPPVRGGIEFEHVSFAYEPSVEILHDINLKIKPGENIAIIGRTGAGKSSLMSLLTRLYDIDKGRITIDGYDIRSVTQESLRRQIGIVPQEPFLFSGTIEENIRYGHPEGSHDDVVSAAKTVGAHEFITHMEDGYHTSVGERGGNLSAGQRQLVCLARAILANPPIMILDEATSSVDTNTERIMQKSLRRLAKGRTCLIIAHRLSTVTSADRIIAMEHGNIIETGNHQELLAKQGLYYEMFGALAAQDLEPQSAA